MSETTQTTDAQKRQQARGKAQTRLNEKYRDELIALTKEEAEKLGVEYSPRKTEQEKAADKVRELLGSLPPEERQRLLTENQPGQPEQAQQQGIYPVPDDGRDSATV